MQSFVRYERYEYEGKAKLLYLSFQSIVVWMIELDVRVVSEIQDTSMYLPTENLGSGKNSMSYLDSSMSMIKR